MSTKTNAAITLRHCPTGASSSTVGTRWPKGVSSGMDCGSDRSSKHITAHRTDVWQGGGGL
eukprot:15385283-Alexandrium_andersonii.AAC.1